MRKTLGLVVIALVMISGCTWREAGSNTVGALASVGAAAAGGNVMDTSGPWPYAAGEAGQGLGDWLFSEGSSTPETKLHPNGYVEPEKKVAEEEERSN